MRDGARSDPAANGSCCALPETVPAAVSLHTPLVQTTVIVAVLFENENPKRKLKKKKKEKKKDQGRREKREVLRNGEVQERGQSGRQERTAVPRGL